jgi:hypothetical protein
MQLYEELCVPENIHSARAALYSEGVKTVSEMRRNIVILLCHSSRGLSLVSRIGGPGSSPVQVMWDLWKTSGTGICFLRIPRFPVTIIPSTAPHSSSIFLG